MKFLEFCAFVGLVLTPAQCVIVKIIDGAEPRDLVGEERELARELFGPTVSTIPASARSLIVLLKGARVGGSMIFNAYLTLWRALVADLGMLAPGEHAVGLISAPDLRLAKQVLRYVQGAVESTPDLAIMLEASGADSITLRRDDGRVIEIAALPATRGGAALRSRTLTSAGFTEASFLKDEGGIGNDRELVRAASPRILPGGMVVLESTPWIEGGLVHELFTLNYNAPSNAIAIRAPTLLMRPDEATAQLVARERERDPVNARTEFDCEFFAGGSTTWIDPSSIALCVNKQRPLTLSPSTNFKTFATGDLGFSSDSSTLVISRIEGNKLVIVELLELQPTKASPLKPSVVFERFSEVMRRHGVDVFIADHHAKEAAREHLEKHGLRFHAAAGGVTGKMANYRRGQALLKEGNADLPNHPRLLQQLREIVARPTPGGGMQITHPRRAGSGHGDLAAALVLALAAAWPELQRGERRVDRGGVVGVREFARQIAAADAPVLDRLQISGSSVVVGPPRRSRLAMRGGSFSGGGF